ncbi:MAG: helix-turn-helix domain-containing protein [Clostridia bacterium]|jgi:excisionase family DNA binding protein|nr:helix-turn-helix domain-containing protein [Clostridia bacterium]
MNKGELKELYSVMFTEYPDIVTVDDIQSMLGVSRHYAYKLITDGYIHGRKIGGAYKVPKINVINYALTA